MLEALDFAPCIWYNIPTNNREVDTMTDREILELILSKMDSMETKMDSLESEVSHIKSDLHGTKLTLENVTNRNIQLVAENFVDLTRKLDENIKITDQTIAYHVKVNFLSGEVEKLKREVEKLKNKTA